MFVIAAYDVTAPRTQTDRPEFVNGIFDQGFHRPLEIAFGFESCIHSPKTSYITSCHLNLRIIGHVNDGAGKMPELEFGSRAKPYGVDAAHFVKRS